MVMPIFIKTVTSKTVALTVEPTETVLQLKQKIKDLEEIPIDAQRLVFGGQMLTNDELTLEECNIHANAIIHIAIRLNGGATLARTEF